MTNEMYLNSYIAILILSFITGIIGVFLRKITIYDCYNKNKPIATDFYRYTKDDFGHKMLLTTFEDFLNLFLIGLVPVINFSIILVFCTRLYSLITGRLPLIISYGVWGYALYLMGKKI